MSSDLASPPIAGAADLFGSGKTHPRRYKIVGPTPIGGVTVQIQSLTDREAQAYENKGLSVKGVNQDRLLDAARRLIQLCLVDASKRPYVTDAHLKEMQDWDTAEVHFLFDECARHCGLRRSDVEDLAKNSGAVPADALPLT